MGASMMKNDEVFFKRFCYPNGCLKNKLGIQDEATLQQTEFHQVIYKMLCLFKSDYQIKDLNDLNHIHRLLFGNLYSWAGKVRQDYDLHKQTNGVDFYAQPFATIPIAWRYINDSLLRPALRQPQISNRQYMELLDNLNTLHPYREGNGRATKMFVQLLARQKGQYLHFPRFQWPLIKAMNAANYLEMQAQVHLYETEQELRPADMEKVPPFDDCRRTIGGYPIAHLQDYRDQKDAILFNLYEGWQPTAAELAQVVEVYQQIKY